MFLKKLFKYLVSIIIILVSIFYGIAIEQKKIFPYYYIIRVSDDFKSLLKSSDAILNLKRSFDKLRSKNSKNDLAKIQPEDKKDITFENIEKKIKETTLLPIEIKGYKYQNIIPNGGAIEYYDGNIIVSDKFGSFLKFSLQNELVSQLNFPNIPNNINEFQKYGDFGAHPHFGIKDLLLVRKKKN